MKFDSLVKLVVLIFSSTLVVFSFQNCANSKSLSQINNDQVSAVNELTSSGAHGTSDLESSKLTQMDFSKATHLFLQLDSIYSQISTRSKPSVNINLQNGEIRSVTQEGEVNSPIRWCLLKDELEELKAILETSKICKPTNMINNSQVCTQVYIYPYAKIELPGEEVVKLGEKSGCSTGIDLCEQHRNAMNGFISYLSSHLEYRKCL
ncbi:MAG: hypothetical protein L6Q37_04070 [Bdellovibrionaceae bacterium]|nr:hypothetical protein [Pseudobdellovibrionaceae bacterium]NUM57137.1 hypothetical protein [Pseudobdellovibrionaceae bacterium]